jgi:hypothetical protein
MDAIYAAHSLTGGDCEVWVDVPEDERLGLYYYEWSLLDCDSQIEALWGDDLVQNSDELARKRGEHYQLRKGSLAQSLINLAQIHSTTENRSFSAVSEAIRDNLLCYFDPVFDEYFRGER